MQNWRPLNKELQKVAIKELNEDPERIAEYVEELKNWIEQQPHLTARTDDQLLLAFLRGCKYNLVKAKSKLDKYYTLRSKFPELFHCDSVETDTFREILHLGISLYLPVPLHGNGPRIMITRGGLYPHDKYSIEDVVKVIYAMHDILLLEDDYATVNGIVLVMDLANCTPVQLLQMRPSLLKRMTAYSLQALPLRINSSHYFNTPSYFEPLYRIMKLMLPEKLQRRVYVHGQKLELLHEHIPRKFLPREYGGTNGTIAEVIAHWERKMADYRCFFRDNANYGMDETKAIMNAGHAPILKPHTSIFGVEGSFRKLNVD